MVGIGGTLKNAIYRDVKSGKAIINDAKEFAVYVDKTIKGISSLYMSSDDVIIEQDPSFHFYYLASDDDPFHAQSYPSFLTPIM